MQNGSQHLRNTAAAQPLLLTPSTLCNDDTGHACHECLQRAPQPLTATPHAWASGLQHCTRIPAFSFALPSAAARAGSRPKGNRPLILLPCMSRSLHCWLHVAPSSSAVAPTDEIRLSRMSSFTSSWQSCMAAPIAAAPSSRIPLQLNESVCSMGRCGRCGLRALAPQSSMPQRDMLRLRKWRRWRRCGARSTNFACASLMWAYQDGVVSACQLAVSSVLLERVCAALGVLHDRCHVK